jgi:uncharacterized protein YdaU (DUF1376 family)
MHYYQHHIGDFLRDTSHLSNDQMAVYLKMLWRYYDTEKPLPDDCEGIAFAVRSDEKTVSLLLRYFFQLCEDGWHHRRCDAEIDAYRQKSEKARFSANARWANANAMRTHTDRNANEPKNDANQEPITIDKEKIDKKEKPARAARASIMPADFYPDEVGCRYAEERKIGLAVELERFRNHHTAKGSRFTSWQAAWRTWCDKAVQFSAASTRNNRPAVYGAGLAIFGNLEAQHEQQQQRIIDITPALAGRLDQPDF